MAKTVGTSNTLTFHITLVGIRPKIWRRFVVLDNISLSELHETIQTVMGWTNSHLHSFFIRKTEYTDKETIEDYGRGKVADSVSLSSLKLKKGDIFNYIYDWGDNWDHRLEVESVSKQEPEIIYPFCLDGARSCPPEDCGGHPGYEDLLNILFDTNHEKYENMKEWAGPYFDPEKFDLALTNDLLQKKMTIASLKNDLDRRSSH